MSHHSPDVGLAAGHAGPVIAVSDLDRARAFYEGQLGLVGEPAPGGWRLTAGMGTVCYLLAGVADAGSASWPVASFRVPDVHAAVSDLRSREVAFLGSDDVPFAVDDDGVSADTSGLEVAWMRDPDGSVLTIFSIPASDDPADELRAVVQERVAAVRDKNPGPLADRQHPELIAFNVLPPLALRGSEAVAEQTRAWFAAYPGEIGYEVRDLRVTANDAVGFCSFLYHVTGTLADGATVDMWVRATLGCERIDGRWRITHDHESVPFDAESGQALIDLAP